MRTKTKYSLLLLLCGLAACLSAFAFMLPAQAEPISNPVLPIEYGFEGEDLNDFYKPDTAGTLMPERSDDARTGEHAMKVNTGTARLLISDADWLVDGTFVEVSWYAKRINDLPLSTWLEVQLWANTNDASHTTITLGKQDHTTMLEAVVHSAEEEKAWKQSKGVIAFYSDGTQIHAYGRNGHFIMDTRSNLIMNPQIMLDFKVYSANAADATALMDDLTFRAATVNADAEVTVVDASGAPLTGAELVVRDEAGKALEDIEVEEDGGVYTLKALPYAKMGQTYEVEAFKDGKSVGKARVGYLTPEATCTPPYSVSITVRDEAGAPVSDAKLELGETLVSSGTEGVYTAEEIYGSQEVKVTKNGYLPSYANVSPANNSAIVILKKQKAVLMAEDNLIADGGGCETGLPQPASEAPRMENAVVSLSDRDQHTGTNAVSIRAVGENSRVLTRYTYAVLKDGTGYAFEAYAKARTEGAALELGFEIPCKMPDGADKAWTYVRGFSEPVVLSAEEWTLVSATISVTFDKWEKTVTYSVNGGEPVTMPEEAIEDVSAMDLVFKVSDGGEVLVDDLALFEEFDATVTVKDETGAAVEDASFELIDHRGAARTIDAVYDEATQSYTISGLRGVVSLIATAGEKEYAPCRLSKAQPNANIEDAFTITVILEDADGNRVTGATVTARQGVITVGTFTESGNGVYVLEGAMGTVSILVNAEGYTFTRTDSVSAANATLTIKGTKDSAPDTGGSEDGDNGAGCNCSSAEGTAAIGTLLLGLAIAGGRRFLR